MKQFKDYFTIIHTFALLLIPIGIILLIYYSFLGKVYLKVTSQNENAILRMLNQGTEIKVESKIKKIGNMQGLGEWVLYLEYENGYKEEKILDDDELHDLYMYINQNGSIAGTKGKIIKYTLIISIFAIIIYRIYRICLLMRKQKKE